MALFIPCCILWAASLCFAKISHRKGQLRSGTAEDKLVSLYKTGLPLPCVLSWLFPFFPPEAFTQPQVLNLGGLAASVCDLCGKTSLFSAADLQARDQPMGLMWDASHPSTSATGSVLALGRRP